MTAPAAIEVYVVLKEDDYETAQGDGYFAYYVATFRTRAEAERNATEQRRSPQRSGYSYHVRAATLTHQVGRGWTITAELRDNERIDTNGDGEATDYDAVARALGAVA